ncbi:MAG: class I SAM-dependent methyltransferase family protein [Candidatus Aenigmatarchaeota archaeon]|nr:class I SAM-dependent methyltransferase family protein [Candidatus Aenigmarchaeota archaeon]
MRIAFDIVGSREKAVAVVDMPEGSDEMAIAKEIMGRYKHVKSVIAKESGRQDPYRLYNFHIITGDQNTEVLHKEHGYILKLDPQKVYFSPREAEERARIAKKVKRGERVLVMFAGVGPYAIAIAKAQPKADIVCVEINPKAVEYADENVQLNKLVGRIKNYVGDVREVVPKIGKFNRIIMPLPESAHLFLDTAFAAAVKGAIIHLYGISEYQKGFPDLEALVKSAATNVGKKIRIIGRQKVLPFAPYRWKARIDIKVL